MNTKIISFALIPVIILLGYILIAGVKKPIDEKVKVERTENAIEERLKLIRDLEISYKSQKGSYTGKWDELIKFAESGKFVIVQTSEDITLKDNGEEEIIVIRDTIGEVPVKDSLSRKYPNFDPQSIANIPFLEGKKFTLFATKIDNGGIMIDVFEARDEYPINPERGAQFDEEGNPYSITHLIAYFNDRLAKKNEEAVAVQRKIRDASSESEKKSFQKDLDEISKFVNLYQKRIEQLETRPLKVGSREEATTAGNWE